jgi:hypothetical protein
LKFHFWVLLLFNKTIYTNFDFSAPQSLSDSEANESILYLFKKIQSNEFVRTHKILVCKLAYELGLHYYLKGNYKDALPNFKLSSNVYNQIDKKAMIYFEREKLDYFLSNCEKPDEFIVINNKQVGPEKSLDIEMKDDLFVLDNNFSKDKDEKSFPPSDYGLATFQEVQLNLHRN